MDLPKPPKDTELRNIIDKLAQFVARNGPEFEHMTKTKQKNNPKFQFLYGGEYFNYYQYKVTTEQAILKQQGNKIKSNIITTPPTTSQAPPALNTVQPWTNPPSLSNVLTLNQIEQQQSVLREQIQQSEQNLNAQYTVLTQQQQSKIDEVVNKAETDTLKRLAELSGLDLDALDSLLQPIMDTCTKDSISNGKGWILQHATTADQCEAVAKYLLQKIIHGTSTFLQKLHVIYLVNDVLHHCARKHADDLKKALEEVVIPMFCNTNIGITEEQKCKLDKLLSLWESKANYFNTSTVKKLYSPVESYAEYKASLVAKHASAIATVTQNMKSTFDSYQTQHNAFVAHATQQIQVLEQQKQAEKQNAFQPPSNFQQNNFLGTFPQISQPIAPQQAPSFIPEDPSNSNQSNVSQNSIPSDSSQSYSENLLGSGISGQNLPGSGIPGQNLPGSGILGQSLPGSGIPGQNLPGSGIPGQNLPGSGIPGQNLPGSGIMGQNLPGSGIMGQNLPGSGIMGQNLPGPGIPGQNLPGSGIMGQNLPPGQNLPVTGILGNNLPGSVIPGQNLPGPGIPGQNLPGSGMNPINPSVLPPMNPSLPPPNLGGPDLGLNFNQPPPGFLPPPGIFPDFSKPPPGFPIPPLLPPPVEIFPSVPYYDLPAGLMVPLIKLEDCSYKSLDPGSIRIPPPTQTSDRLNAAVDAFYSTPSHDRPRDSEGWEKLGLYEYYKTKNMAKKLKEEQVALGLREKSRSPSPIVLKKLDKEMDQKKRRYSSKSPSPRSPVRRRSTSSKRERNRRKRSRSRSKTRSPQPIKRERSLSPIQPMFMPVTRQPEREIDPSNKGHQLLKKMGWGGSGLGAKGQGIEAPITGGEVRDRQDMYKGIGININDPYESFRKHKGAAFITRMKARAEERAAEERC